MTPGEIAGLLDERFQLLTAGPRKAVEHHQTLRAAVDWSYGPLSPIWRTGHPRSLACDHNSQTYKHGVQPRTNIGGALGLSTLAAERTIVARSHHAGQPGQREGGGDMAVVTTTIIQVKPDRWEEFLDQTRKTRPIMEQAGAKNIRLLAGLVAGQQTGTVVYISEADDFAAAGVVMDRAIADPEIQKILVLGDASPMAGYQTSYFVDVPL
jgi:hypothetical protein